MQAIGLLAQFLRAFAQRLAGFALLRGLQFGLARGAMHGAPALELFDLVHVDVGESLSDLLLRQSAFPTTASGPSRGPDAVEPA